MRQRSLVFFFSLINTISLGQHIYPEKFNNCPISQFCLDCGNPEAKAPQNFGMELAEKLNSKSLKSISGFIELQILVDSLGTPCLLSAKNESNTKIRKLNIQQAIQNSSKWTPAISQGQPTSTSVSLKLNFIDGKLSIQRREFNTNMVYKDTPEIIESNLISQIPLNTPGQGVISDSVLYSLTRQSLDNLTLTKVKIFHGVVKPSYLIETENRILRGIGHFSDDDLRSIKWQISDPTITNWNNPIFTQESNFEIVSTLTNDECVFISLPLVTLDTNTIVIYYERWRKEKNKKSGSGTVTVWERSLLGGWVNQMQQLLWIREYEVHKKFNEPAGSWKELEN